MTGDFTTPRFSADLPLMLLYQKSGYRWSREFNDGKKQFSLIAVIKTVVADCFATFRLCPFFELPLPEVHILIE